MSFSIDGKPTHLALSVWRLTAAHLYEDKTSK